MSVYLIGGGPSLRTFPWWILQGREVVAINKAALDPRVPWRRMLSMDVGFWKRYGEQVQEAAWGRPCVHVRVEDEKLPAAGPSVVLPCCARGGSNPHLRAEWGRSLDGIGCGGNSGYAALNYAAVAYPGATLYLLGYDMRGDGHGSQAWWHDGYPEMQREAVYDRMIEAFRVGVPEEVKRRVRVLGPSRLVSEGIFERGEL